MSHQVINKHKKLSFTQWIDELGPQVLSEKLGVCYMTIHHWRTGKADPRVDQMRRIKRMTGGAIGYEQMIDRPMKRKATRKQ